MSVIKTEALRALKAAIECAIPELKDKICESPTPPNHKLGFPSLAFIPVSFRYQPEQASQINEIGEDKLIVAVGSFDVAVQLRLAAATPGQRGELEQQLIDLFLNTPLHPGVLITPVLTAPCYGEFVAAWEFENSEWDDENAFDNEFWSVALITGTIPALTTRTGSYTIRQLKFGLGGIADTAPDPFATTSSVEVIRVNEDGTFNRV